MYDLNLDDDAYVIYTGVYGDQCPGRFIRRKIMLICKCMDVSCPRAHWGDLNKEQQASFKPQQEGEPTNVRMARQMMPFLPEDTEDKAWPPRNMETK